MSARTRELCILIGFVVIAGVGVVTVLLPETQNAEDKPAAGAGDTVGAASPASPASPAARAHK